MHGTAMHTSHMSIDAASPPKLLSLEQVKLFLREHRYSLGPILACFVTLALAAFSGPLDIAEGVTNDAESRLAKGPSVLLKLSTAMCAGILGAWGCATIPRVRQAFLSVPGLLLSIVALLFLLSCITSVVSGSFPIAVVFFSYLLFIPTALTVLGFRGALAAVLTGAFFFSLGAIFLYVFVPRYGIFPEDLGDGVIVERLGGMSQPNHTGRTAMLGLLIASFFIRFPRSPRFILSISIVLFGVVGMLAMSRTALVAALICLAIVNLDLLLTRLGLIAICLSFITGLGGLMFLAAIGYEDAIAEKLLGAVTKTGDIEEVTSVTGRSEIWERAIKLIKGDRCKGMGWGPRR